MIPLQDTVQARRSPWITWFLIALNFTVFIYMVGLPYEQAGKVLFRWGIVPVKLYHGGTPWVLVTSMFLHGGWYHLISNMWVLYIFGDNVEDRLGHFRYLCFYLLCGIVAGLTQCMLYPDSAIPVVGASGAISGVLGAYVLLFPHAKVITLIPLGFIPVFIEVSSFIFIGIWYFSQLLGGLAGLLNTEQFHIAWWAHIGGFFAGMVLLPWFKLPQRDYRDFYPDEYWPW